MRTPRFPLIALGLVSALAACGRIEAPPEPIRSARTMVVGTGTADGVQEFAAEIRARHEVRLGFRVSGKMIERSAEVGKQVRKGQVLARLDPLDLRLAQDAARASTRTAEVALELAQADFKRFKDLRDQGFISTADLERREAAVRSARAQFEQAQAQAGVQGNQASYSILSATESGIVTAVDAEVGAVLSAGSSVVRVALDGPRDAVFSVPEDKVDLVRRLTGRVGAIGVKTWQSNTLIPGTVREVGAMADAVTRTFQVKVDIGQASVQLGQTASARIALPSLQGIARLPLSAVLELKGRTVVWVLDPKDSTVRARVVEVAGAEGNDVVVSKGLDPGDIVVTAGVHVLNEGQQVKQLAAARPAIAASLPAPR